MKSVLAVIRDFLSDSGSIFKFLGPILAVLGFGLKIFEAPVIREVPWAWLFAILVGWVLTVYVRRRNAHIQLLNSLNPTFSVIAEVRAATSNKGVSLKWARIIVSPTGVVPLKNCEVKLIRVDRPLGGKHDPELIVDQAVLPFRWSNRGEETVIDVQPGVPHTVDVVCANEQNDDLLLCTNPRKPNVMQRLKNHSLYHFHIAVTADNCSVKKSVFVFDWRGFNGFSFRLNEAHTENA